MFNLIELTQTEVALQDMSFTLKEITEKFGIRHDNAMRDFKADFSKLSEKQVELLATQIEESIFTSKSGKGKETEHVTLKISLPLMLWFSAKYNPELRMNIVNYALTKLDDERKELVLTIQENEEKFLKETKKLQNKIHDISVKKFNHHDGFQTVSRLVHELALDFTVSDIMDDLTDRGIVETLKVVKKLRKPLCPKLTRRGSHGELLVSEEFIKDTYTNMDEE